MQLKDGEKTLLEDTIKLIKGSSQHKNIREIQLHVALALNLLQLNRLRRIEPHIQSETGFQTHYSLLWCKANKPDVK